MPRYQVPLKLNSRQRRFRYTGRKAVYGLIVALLLGGLVAADRAGFFGWRATPDLEKYGGKTFKVVKAVDGDTIDIDVPDGKYPHTRIRLWGVDTPETKDPRKPGFVGFFGPEASAFTKDQTLHKNVRIELEEGKDPRDKYHRLLAWVYLPDGRLLNRVLVEQGYGYADPRFPHHLEKEFKHLQAAAMNAHRGLWASGPPNDIPDYYTDGKHKLPTK
jgi:endonuclease YncB( thermonuclease family)